jgi:hypothetical protein
MSSSQTDQQMVNDYHNNLQQKEHHIMRSAIIHTDAKPRRLAAYLPSNYQTIIHQHTLYVVGTDKAGWTLDGYVLPRLASGSIYGTETTDQSTIDALEASLNNDKATA